MAATIVATACLSACDTTQPPEPGPTHNLTVTYVEVNWYGTEEELKKNGRSNPGELRLRRLGVGDDFRAPPDGSWAMDFTVVDATEDSLTLQFEHGLRANQGLGRVVSKSVIQVGQTKAFTTDSYDAGAEFTFTVA